MTTSVVFNGYHTLIAATIVLLVGSAVVRRVALLRDFNIPDPVVGGLIVAVLVSMLHGLFGLTFEFDRSMQTGFMLMFFASIGLSADFSRLRAGGMPLLIFLGVVSTFILVQNLVGVSLAALMGQNPLIGLILGSITLTGGHGTGAAYGHVLTEQLGIANATEVAFVAATFGLVAGGLVGGPVARRLVNKMGRQPVAAADPATASFQDEALEYASRRRVITANSAIETLALFAACLAVSSLGYGYLRSSGTWSKVPQFVWALGFGVLVRNFLPVKKIDNFDHAVDVFGNASLSLFLAMALMSMKLWQLADLAGVMTVILLAQVVTMALFAYFVTYRAMGKDYDAAVLVAGHCGFGLGASPTAVANMQSVTNTFGPSHKAFLIVPLVGAFFIDFVNFFILSQLISLLS